MVEKIVRVVKWIKPSSPVLKLNTDRSCINATCGGGGVLRDYQGRVIMAFIFPLGHGTNNQAEVVTLLFGLKWCIVNGVSSIIVEVVSLLVLNCTIDVWEILWRIEDTVKEIKNLVGIHDIPIQHCFREANKVANKLASLSHSLTHVQVYSHFNTIPRIVKGILNIDRWECPSFRVIKRKANTLSFDLP
ncbi:hypothetical protein MTR67_023659 [Solanum verrucosum]|uniref:RNase H type-1 domain-containing protein n=1 Tax=Solanum verrucosum TaxID=315347 RepID=A0AAF0R2B6_SOLVR|nr:hypothetical protein MTR67_023659 [Solanum verrucosum]